MSKGDSIWRQLGLVGTIGMEMAFSVVIGVVLGYLLDRQLGTVPVFTVILMLAGTGLGFFNLFKIIKKFNP